MTEAEAMLEYRQRIERISVLTKQLEEYAKQISLSKQEESDELQLRNFKALHEIFIRDARKLDKIRHEF